MYHKKRFVFLKKRRGGCIKQALYNTKAAMVYQACFTGWILLSDLCCWTHQKKINVTHAQLSQIWSIKTCFEFGRAFTICQLDCPLQIRHCNKVSEHDPASSFIFCFCVDCNALLNWCRYASPPFKSWWLDAVPYLELNIYAVYVQCVE
jgi:hypothetical protein